MHTNSRLRSVLASLAVTATAIGLTACGGGGGSSDAPAPPTPVSTQVPRLDESRCPYTLHPSQQPGTGVRCGELVVLQDRANPTGPTVRIPFAVFRPATPGALPPVVYLTGGPGQTWTDSVPTVQAGQSPGFVGGAKLPRDEVVLEQRGSIATTPALSCPAVSWGPEMFRDTAAALLAALPGMKSCADGLIAKGVQPRHFTTDDMAADLEDLRQLLGYGKVVLNGVSFGTMWALAVVRNHGAGVDAMVLDSVVSPAVRPVLTSGAGLDQAFSAVAAACAAQPACAAAYPNLDNRVSALLDKLNAQPLPWARGPAGEFNATVAVGVLSSVALFAPGSLPSAVAAIEGVVTGGLSSLSSAQQDDLVVLARSGLDSSIVPAPGQAWSVVCADNATTTRAELAAAAESVRPAMRPARAAWNGAFDSICQGWPFRKDLPASAYQPLNSPVKTLILSGALDPSTPPSWAQQVAATLSNRTLVSFPARAHSIQTASPCAQTLVNAFLAGQPLDPSCAAAETLSFE
ncbi:MAG: alpha/beta fold hydrolase [Burkholderiaceae bacterium]|jgi:pimeloyl-ACP methyl ester carboxylesterase|nr:alpha/beta hydrolase [Burkholderiaceae bacterium]MCZ8175771.1 alpha/beta fold hydrolase [Burkholderiaceae bacterium]